MKSPQSLMLGLSILTNPINLFLKIIGNTITAVMLLFPKKLYSVGIESLIDSISSKIMDSP